MSTLNERIAKAKGWIAVHRADEIHYYTDKNGYYKGRPDWSGSIADAWELVEELAAKNYEPRIDYCNDGSWLVGLVVDDEEVPEVADTAPEAITAAYLAAMEE